jgi:hypothetical protein
MLNTLHDVTNTSYLEIIYAALTLPQATDFCPLDLVLFVVDVPVVAAVDDFCATGKGAFRKPS